MNELLNLRMPSEHSEQVAVVAWLRARGIPHFAVPNGAKVSVRERAKLKREGLTPGVADLVLPVDGGAVALEMKARNAGKLSKAQREWRDGLPKGWKYVVFHGAKEAIDWLGGRYER